MVSATSSQSPSQTPPGVLAGQTIQMMRKTHGVTIQGLADLVGISRSHLSRIETGQRPATPDLTNRICAALASLPVPEDVAS
jgi:transcriptional regulator with XRE-family HTH domain